MLLEEMCARLMAAAKNNGWSASDAPDLVEASFRGGDEPADVSLPNSARGLMLGSYPVIATELRLDTEENVKADLKAAHHQMIIARSHLTNVQVIDAHIFFVAAQPNDGDWEQRMDLVERNETVCRKLVWMPDRQDMDGSFDAFIAHTFLARPWLEVAARQDASLDQNETLVEAVLREKGLSEAAAATWVELAASKIDDPDQLVDQLVAAMEART